jgi:hypothetical protein
LTIDGGGVVQFSAANTYGFTGTGTTINSGASLLISNTSALGGSTTMTINGSLFVDDTISWDVGDLSGSKTYGANATIGGTAGTTSGSYNANLTIDNDGSTFYYLKPGNADSYVGKLAVTGTGAFNGGGTYVWDISDVNGSTAGTDWDFIEFSGALSIGATSGDKFNIQINNTGAVSSPSNKTYKILDSSSDISGIFDESYFNLTELNASVGTWTISVGDGSGTNTALFLNLNYSSTPEPGTWVMVCLAGIFLSFKYYHKIKPKEKE